MRTDPEAALVGIFAHDGFVREFAVKTLEGPLPAVWLSLQHETRRRRWGEGLNALVDHLARHPVVMEALVGLLASASRAGSITVFQALSRSPAFDARLHKIATRAQRSHLRALALNVPIAGPAIRPTGRCTKHWMDRSLGISKTLPEYETHASSLEIDRAEVLAGAMADRA